MAYFGGPVLYDIILYYSIVMCAMKNGHHRCSIPGVQVLHVLGYGEGYEIQPLPCVLNQCFTAFEYISHTLM